MRLQKRYSTEKKDIEKDAKKLEGIRDSFQAREPYFPVVEALLQIAIVMSSVSHPGPLGPDLLRQPRPRRGGRRPHPQRGYFVVVQLPFFRGGH